VIKGLKIVCADDLCGIFRLYGDDGLLVNSAEDNKLRILKAEYNLLDSGIENKFKDADSITWLIPKVNTMIQAPLAGQDYEVRDNVTLEEDS
jgi:hypothetical protein